jgi:photosystem II stability/assembly factor-like uncharacterized protein
MQFVRFYKRIDFKLCLFILIAVLLLCSNIILLTTPPATASSDAAKWVDVSIPAQGNSGNWVLATGSDIQCLTAAPDGTLYAYCRGLPYTLYQSQNSGISWSYISKVKDDIVGIAISPVHTDTIYYATSSTVYRSTDAGNSFQSLPASPGGAGNNNIEITSLDAAFIDGNIIAVSTRDKDSLEFGGVYIFDEAETSFTWTDTEIGNYDVYSIAFSPNYPLGGQLVAVITDEIDTYTSVKPGDAGWNTLIGNARFSQDNSLPHIPVATTVSAAIAFPDSYSDGLLSGRYVYYVAVDTGTGDGDVYQIACVVGPGDSIARDLNAGYSSGLDNIDVSGLAASGDYPSISLLAGAADNAQTYFSGDGGDSWTVSRKNPTGESTTSVLLSTDFQISGIAYVATSGTDSAFSITRDGGYTWNQLSLIDNRIDTVVDLAPSPAYERDSVLFMITFGNGHSLWRSHNGGVTWERIFSGSRDDVDTLTLAGLPPQYNNYNQTVFIAGESHGNPSIWESIDNGQSFRCRPTRDPGSGGGCLIDAWAIVNETTLFIGSYDGSEGRIYKTINSGFFFFEGAAAGSQPINSIALSPDYETDGNIIAGNTNGRVFRSDDGGESFESLPRDAASPPLTGRITVAFVPDYTNKRVVYAASDAADGGVYRFITGTSTEWEPIHDNLPADAGLNQLAASDGGALYAVNSDTNGGMERCLGPSSATSAMFETAANGLTDGATLYGLWQCGHRIWSIDTTNVKVMTFNDTLTTPVIQVSPGNNVAGIGNLVDNTIRNISLNWETLEGATGYEWRCDSDTDLDSVPDGFHDTTQARSTVLPPLDSSTTYYWRVRVSSPVLSPWSEKRSFTTALDPVANKLALENPVAGAGDVPIEPLFQWTGVIGADAYELVVSMNPEFTDPVITRKDDSRLPSNAWQSDITLEYETAYYWKVRAVNGSTGSAWSATGAFTTEPEPDDTGTVAEVTISPAPESPPSNQFQPSSTLESNNQQSSPLPPAQPPYVVPSSAMPDWVIYLIASQVLMITLALVVILILVSRVRRPR